MAEKLKWNLSLQLVNGPSTQLADDLAVDGSLDFQCWLTRPNETVLALEGAFRPCIAGGAYLPTLCDFLFMSRVSANMWLGGPRQTAAGGVTGSTASSMGANLRSQASTSFCNATSCAMRRSKASR